MRQVMPIAYEYKDSVVPVIATFDGAGHVAPLFVRIQGESVKVQSYWMSPDTESNCMEFKCKLLCHNRITSQKLFFHRAERVWTIEE